MADTFYGPDQALIHHEDFGKLAGHAASELLSLLRRAGLVEGTVVDLGCGSGILARAVSDAGYDVLGVDISPDMLEIAAANAPRARFERTSLLDVEFPRCVAVTAIGEALNYATDPRAGLDQIEAMAVRVKDALEPGGVFLFDISTPGRGGLARVMHQFHDRATWTLYMRAEESEDGATLDRVITIFRRNDDGSYRRIDEHHVLRLYDAAAVRDALRRAGLNAEERTDYSDDRAPFPGWKVIVAKKPV